MMVPNENETIFHFGDPFRSLLRDGVLRRSGEKRVYAQKDPLFVPPLSRVGNRSDDRLSKERDQNGLGARFQLSWFRGPVLCLLVSRWEVCAEILQNQTPYTEKLAQICSHPRPWTVPLSEDRSAQSPQARNLHKLQNGL